MLNINKRYFIKSTCCPGKPVLSVRWRAVLHFPSLLSFLILAPFPLLPAGGGSLFAAASSPLADANFLFAAGNCATAQPFPPAGDRPNIILIMADDLGYETLECNGGTSYRTPRLNEMARKGMRFENCHASPLCTPSRVKLMTGKYNFRNYIGFGLLDPSERTFGHLLKEAGYLTGITGKWQLRGLPEEQEAAGNRRGSYPVEAGFDEYCLWQVDQRLSRYKDPSVRIRGEETKLRGGEYGPDIFSRFARDFIERHRDTTFFLYYPMVLVHSPFQPVPGSPGYQDNYPEKASDTARFAAMVGYMDKIVGSVVDKVEELGLSRNTLIIFMGDNGTDEEIVSRANGKMIPGGKSGRIFYSTHVPAIACWEGVVRPGSVNRNLVDFTDFLPTFLEIAGIRPPDDFFTDGLSFYGQLTGRSGAETRDWVFCSYDPRRGKRIPGTWIHDKEWKLYQTGEFYNIAEDPEERHPLTGRLNPAGASAKERLQKGMARVFSAGVAP